MVDSEERCKFDLGAKGLHSSGKDVQVQSGLKGISFLCKPCHFKWLIDNNNNIISEWVINHYSHGFDFMN